MTEAMETQPISTVQQRREERDAELVKILKLADYICTKFYTKSIREMTEDEIDLDASIAVSGILSTVYSSMRKISNQNIASRGQTHLNAEATIGNVTHSITSLIEEFTKLDGYSPFSFLNATPMVDMLTSFKLMYDEVRISCSKFKVKSKGSVIDVNINKYGLGNQHIPLLTGITFKPERRSGLMKSLGPLTLAINLAHETQYTGKLATALQESIQMLPMHSQIVSCLKETNSPFSCNSLFRALADVLLMTGSRSKNKIHFPLFLFYKIAINKIDFNFAGTDGIKAYCAAARLPNVRWVKKSNAMSDEIAQVVFHSIFGTSVEDLGLLGSITTHKNWAKRSDLSLVFEKADSAPRKSFTPIMFTRIAKLASAIMVKGTGSVQPMLINKIVFAGNRKRNYTDAFMSYLETGTRTVAYGSDITSLTYALNVLKEDYIKLRKKGDFKNAGTTKWEVYDQTLKTWVEDPGFMAEEAGTYFYS